jgi:hypothetical protein
MICQACFRETRTPAYAENTMCRCYWCGTPHSMPSGERIAPSLLWIGAPVGVVSPWFSARYRPYVAGVFECEFDGGLRLRLRWSGTAWEWCGQPVDTSTLIKWRGKW